MESRETILLNGESLTIEQVVAVARRRVLVAIAPSAQRRVACCRQMVEELVDRGEKVYGLTTGFGKLRDVSIARKDLQQLQVNLIRSHACGVGPVFPEDVVRAALLLRANTLCRGNSGIRVETLLAVVHLLNDGIYPYVPQQGSVGASGDLAPLSHLALVVMGDPAGRVLPRSQRAGDEVLLRAPGPEQFVPCGSISWDEASLAPGAFQPVELHAKEGLALNNGTQFMAALGCLLVHDAEIGMEWSELATAMSLEAHRGVRHAFQPELHRVRNLSHQAATARRILAYTVGSEILDVLLNTADLARARHYLRQAREHLLPAQTGENGLAKIQAEIDELIQGLDAYLPAEGGAPTAVLAQRQASPRLQIAAFEELLAPLRRRATSLLYQLDHPDLPFVPLAREALGHTLGALSHAVPAAPPVQDDYSLRCSPQVMACGHRALQHAREVLEVEINSATDNPLLFPPEPPGGFAATSPADYRQWLREPPQTDRLPECVLGGGNFHGEPVGMVLDYLAIALAEVANISERRTAQLVDEGLSNGLPPFLVESSGLNSGFMIPQYTAAALVSENKVLCHPATVDSVPTCAGSEDHVSMGTIAARKGVQVLENVLHVIAIEVLAALQGLTFRAPLRPGEGVTQAVTFMRGEGFRPVEDDRSLHPEITQLRELIRQRPPVPRG